MPGKAVNQSHWSKPFDTVLSTGTAKLKDLLLLDMLTAWKQQLDYKTKLSIFCKELIQEDFRINEGFWNCTKLYIVLWKSTVVLKLLIKWPEKVEMTFCFISPQVEKIPK